MMKFSLLVVAFVGISLAACEDESVGGNDCYTCDSCTEYPNILNGREYCVDGFDNRSDWEANKSAQESESGCTCTE